MVISSLRNLTDYLKSVSFDCDSVIVWADTITSQLPEAGETGLSLKCGIPSRGAALSLALTSNGMWLSRSFSQCEQVPLMINRGYMHKSNRSELLTESHVYICCTVFK